MGFSRRQFLRGLIVVPLFGLWSGTATADLYDDYTNSVSRQPFVAFLARPSEGDVDKPGHAFVGIGVELDNGLTVYERLLGY